MGAAPGQLFPHLQLKHLPPPRQSRREARVVAQPPARPNADARIASRRTRRRRRMIAKISIAKQNGRLKPSVLFCRSQSRPPVQAAAFVPLRSRPKSHGRPKTKRSRRTSGRVSGSEQVCVSHRFQKNDVPIDSVPSTVQAFQKFTAFQKAQVCKEMQAFLTISRVHPSPKRHRSEDGIDK